jgi:osmoprotectant transport system ATP-binding protein
MITHDMLEALDVADRIAVLHAGCLIAEGTAAALVGHDHDYVRELMASPRRHAERVGALLAPKPH